jgi:hypothetical protein
MIKKSLNCLIILLILLSPGFFDLMKKKKLYTTIKHSLNLVKKFLEKMTLMLLNLKAQYIPLIPSEVYLKTTKN